MFREFVARLPRARPAGGGARRRGAGVRPRRQVPGAHRGRRARRPGRAWSATPAGPASSWPWPAVGGSRSRWPSPAATTPTTRPAPSRWPTGAASPSRRPPGAWRASPGWDGGWRRAARAGGVEVVDDYAHHPAEIRATLAAARERGPGRVVVVFQPHLPSRTRALGPELGAALGAADVVVVTDVYLAREPPDPAATGRDVAARVPGPARVVHAPTPRRSAPRRPSPRSARATSSSPWGRATSPSWGRSWWPAWKNSPSMGIPTTAPALPELERDAPLAPLTSIRVGGPADRLARVGSFRAASAALAWAREEGVPVAVVGRGSNLLVSDAGFRGLALRLVGRLTAISVRGVGPVVRGRRVAAARGAAGRRRRPGGPGVGGEHPGHGRRRGGHERRRPRGRAGPGAAVGGRLLGRRAPAGGARGPRPGLPPLGGRPGRGGGRGGLRAAPGRRRGDRRAGSPSSARTAAPPSPRACGPSAASSPTRAGDSAGRLLEAAGCKGLQVGGARFSPVHANFIEASPGSTAADVLALMAEGRRRVLPRGGPRLEPEVRVPRPGARHRPRAAPGDR